jgi:phosphoribosylformylglycinamidine synthase
VPVRRLGTTGGDTLTLGSDSIVVKALKDAYEGWLPAYMAGQD